MSTFLFLDEPAPKTEVLILSEEDRKQLEALGYIE
jgi:hypothetical protein